MLSLHGVVDGLLLLHQHLLVYDCQTLSTLCQRDVCCFVRTDLGFAEDALVVNLFDVDGVVSLK